jgi:NRAMP (natural resistance-associated macrophage protein)-like metal ion transporter
MAQKISGAPTRHARVVDRGTPRKILRYLGPGLVSGISDDDPSGIATYSQAGALLGFAACWIMLFCYPLMVVSQEISARIGRATGLSVVGAIGRHYPRWVLAGIVGLVAFANVVNLGADLGAMADVLGLLIGGPRHLYVVLFGLACAALLLLLRYQRYVRFVAWASLSLLAYFLTAFSVPIPWRTVLHHTVVPMLPLDVPGIAIFVAVMGTTISPYLFVWQSALEADRVRALALGRQPPAAGEVRRIRIDTYAGMAVAALVAYAVIVTAAATLHPAGIVDIQTAAQAAEALRPATGALAHLVFSVGIIGTGLLAVPMLAGSAAYALAESRGWPVGLARAPGEARAFYGFILAATLVGTALNFAGISPIRALLWSAVINGVLAVPVLVAMMLVAIKPAVMGGLALSWRLAALGWLTTGVMAATAFALLATLAW